MSIPSHSLAILALFITSMIVRVLPVFLRFSLSAASRGLLERVLPMAVFLNFAAYICLTEVQSSPAAAVSAIAVVTVITFCTRTGLVLTTFAATVVYALCRMSLPI